jgi:flagellar motor switch protein FliN
MKQDNGRETSWLVERWTAAISAALEEAGCAVNESEWAPAARSPVADAAATGVLWFLERNPAGGGESVALGLAPFAHSVLAGLAPAGADTQPLQLLQRAAGNVRGAAVALERAAPPDCGAYALRFHLEDGRELEVALAVLAEKPMRERMGMLLQVEVPVTISLGKAHMPLKEALKLARGSVIELDRTFSDPVEVVVNGRVVARGDIVVVEEKYAVRIREIHREESSQVWSGLGGQAIA